MRSGVVHAVESVSLELRHGEALGLVGESGSGKTATAMSVLRLLPPPGRIVSGQITLEGRDLLAATDEEMRRIRGGRMALVPQNPMSALNPLFTIGWQLSETLLAHQTISRREARRQVVDALHATGIPDADRQVDRYPHQFSGGMRQRVLIAMAILNRPPLLLADEPTTALDTTMQAKVLELMRGFIDRDDMSLLLITHNMGVVASVCDRVAVMYAGQVVELGDAAEVFSRPLHPYTELLLAATPRIDRKRERSSALDGTPPTMMAPPSGCAFRDRCPLAEAKCVESPALLELQGGRSVRCWVAQRDRLPGHAR
jgi:peptide/nickel transport system ATP-binding protein